MILDASGLAVVLGLGCGRGRGRGRGRRVGFDVLGAIVSGASVLREPASKSVIRTGLV